MKKVVEETVTRRSAGDSSFKENPYIYLPPDDSALISCLYCSTSFPSFCMKIYLSFSNRLHLKPNFPAHNVFVRNPVRARVLYLSNDIVKSIIQHNSYERLRLTAAGTKVFSKQEGSGGTEFRVLGEGLQVVLPYVDPQSILEGDMTSLRILLESHYPLSAKFPEGFKNLIESQCEHTFLDLKGALILPPVTQHRVAIWCCSPSRAEALTWYSQYGSPTFRFL